MSDAPESDVPDAPTGGPANPLVYAVAGLAVGLVVGLGAGFGLGRATATPEAPATEVAAPATPTVSVPPAIPPAIAPAAPAGAPDAAPVRAGKPITLPTLPGATLAQADLKFVVTPPKAPRDRVTLADGVVTVRAIEGTPGVVGACTDKRFPVADQLGVKLEWRRLDVPTGSADAFGRVIVRAHGADGKVVKGGYLALARAPGAADWKPLGKVLAMPAGAVTAQFCAEISGPAGSVEIRGLELTGVPAGSTPG